VLKMLDEKICQAKVALARTCSGPRPKGVGALSQMQLFLASVASEENNANR